MIIFLDESGDLGFDLSKRKTSRYFVITLLVVDRQEDANSVRRAVERTLRWKVHGRKGKKHPASELKGSKASLEVKGHLWRQLARVPFSLYAIVLNKQRVNADLRSVPDRLYNYLARLVIDELVRRGLFQNTMSVNVVIDRRKNQREIEEFNRYIDVHLRAVIDPKALLYINHYRSHEEKGLQAVDMFAWGIFRKYENSDLRWFDVYRDKVAWESVYLR